MPQPIPFEITERDNARFASNGTVRVALLDGGKMYRRRAISGIPIKPPAEVLIPQLNQLAGELLAQPDTPAHVAVGRLLAMAGMIPTAEPQRHEWLVAQLDDVRVYTNGVEVIITKQELSVP